MNELMEDQLGDLKSELYITHSSAYNTAYNDEIFEDIMGELSKYFGDGEWVSRPHTYRENTEVQRYKAPIHNFESNIVDYLRENKGYYSGTLEYWGEYLGVIKDQNDCLSVIPPDFNHPFGHSKAEYFSSMIEGFLILVAAVSIGYASVVKILNPGQIDELGTGLVISIVASLINLWVGRVVVG
jgi:hypothetical protein